MERKKVEKVAEKAAAREAAKKDLEKGKTTFEENLKKAVEEKENEHGRQMKKGKTKMNFSFEKRRTRSQQALSSKEEMEASQDNEMEGGENESSSDDDEEIDENVDITQFPVPSERK